jgi:dolichol-phosphate mannosyltransferase
MIKSHRISVSILVPTYKEAESIGSLIESLADFKHSAPLELEVIIIDDDSNDGIAQVVASYSYDWIRLIVRSDQPRGLSESIVDGLKHAKNEFLVVMDADLSHPPSAIPKMVLALESGSEMAIGSRYVKGGSTDHAWGFYRWANSRIATLLTRPLTSIKDPMSGFFALRRSTIEEADDLRPTGYKIGLELIVKCDISHVAEIPIHFSDRTAGESKLSLGEQLKFLCHLRRLYQHRLRFWTDFIQFGLVGVSGLGVNLAVVTLVSLLGGAPTLALAAGVLASFFSNFFMNRLITFRGYSQRSTWYQLAGFASACSLGMVLNLTVARTMHGLYPEMPLQVAATAGVGCGFLVNFVINRYHVFKRDVIRPKTVAESSD